MATVSLRSAEGSNTYSLGAARFYKIRDLKVVDRQKLQHFLDSQGDWELLAGREELGLTSTDVKRIGQREKVGASPADKVLDTINELGMNVLDLFILLKKVHLPYAMELIKPYVPVDYHQWIDLPEMASMQGGIVQHPRPTHPTPPRTAFVPGSSSSLQSGITFMLSQQSSVLEQGSSSDGLGDYLNTDEIGRAITLAAFKSFEFNEIKKATNNFDKDFLLSEGHHGSVYKVTLRNTEYAAKVFKQQFNYDHIKADLQTYRNFIHPNIVPIMGQSLDGERVILLYEYMCHGTLRECIKTYTMRDRLSVLVDAARGLQYLHSNKPAFLHRNISSSTILVGEPHAKLSGFNFSRTATASETKRNTSTSRHSYTHRNTKLDSDLEVRNQGYLANEVYTGHASTKSDTYAFGVVIYEVCTGLRPYDSTRRADQHELCLYINSQLEEAGKSGFDMRDTSISWCESTYNSLFELAEKCTMYTKKGRPSMQIVYDALLEIRDSMSEMANPQLDRHKDEEDELSLNLQSSEPSLSVYPPPPRPPPPPPTRPNQIYMPMPTHRMPNGGHPFHSLPMNQAAMLVRFPARPRYTVPMPNTYYAPQDMVNPHRFSVRTDPHPVIHENDSEDYYNNIDQTSPSLSQQTSTMSSLSEMSFNISEPQPPSTPKVCSRTNSPTVTQTGNPSLDSYEEASDVSKAQHSPEHDYENISATGGDGNYENSGMVRASAKDVFFLLRSKSQADRDGEDNDNSDGENTETGDSDSDFAYQLDQLDLSDHSQVTGQ